MYKGLSLAKDEAIVAKLYAVHSALYLILYLLFQVMFLYLG